MNPTHTRSILDESLLWAAGGGQSADPQAVRRNARQSKSADMDCRSARVFSPVAEYGPSALGVVVMEWEYSRHMSVLLGELDDFPYLPGLQQLNGGMIPEGFVCLSKPRCRACRRELQMSHYLFEAWQHSAW